MRCESEKQSSGRGESDGLRRLTAKDMQKLFVVSKMFRYVLKSYSISSRDVQKRAALTRMNTSLKALFGYLRLKFNLHHINVPSNA
jgi:hypothetical protein